MFEFKQIHRVLLSFFIPISIVFFPLVGHADFDASYVRGLAILNNQEIRPLSDGLYIKGLGDITIKVPAATLNPDKEHILTLTIKSSNPTGLIMPYWVNDKGVYFHPNTYLQIKNTQKFHTYRLNLKDSLRWKGPIKEFVLVFYGSGDEIVLKDFQIKEPKGSLEYLSVMAETFFNVIPFTQKSVNMSFSPYIFGVSLMVILNVICLFLVLSVFTYVYFLKGDKEKTLKLVVCFSLFLWLFYGAKNLHNDYLVYRNQSDAGEGVNKGRFVAPVGDAYVYSGLLKRDAPEGTKGFSFYPRHTYIRHIIYDLYPMKYKAFNSLESGDVVMAIDGAVTSGSMVMLEEGVYFKGEVVKTYNNGASLVRYLSSEVDI